MAAVAGAGSSLAAARPGGYRDGAEDATTVPSAAIATTAVTAWSAVDRAGDRRNDQRAVRGRPGLARLRRLAGVAEHGSGRHAAGIALGELLA